MWRRLQTSVALALHVGGDWPELSMELWAIRRVR
jgi:predicted component of type VI protein secretion system